MPDKFVIKVVSIGGDFIKIPVTFGQTSYTDQDFPVPDVTVDPKTLTVISGDDSLKTTQTSEEATPIQEKATKPEEGEKPNVVSDPESTDCYTVSGYIHQR